MYGRIQWRANNFSKILETRGRREVGRKWAGSDGLGLFGTGGISASLKQEGTHFMSLSFTLQFWDERECGRIFKFQADKFRGHGTHRALCAWSARERKKQRLFAKSSDWGENFARKRRNTPLSASGGEEQWWLKKTKKKNLTMKTNCPNFCLNSQQPRTLPPSRCSCSY